MAHSPAAKDSSLCVVKMKKHMYFAQYIFTEESRVLFHFINTVHFLKNGILFHYLTSSGSTESFHCSFIFRGAGKAAACSYIQV